MTSSKTRKNQSLTQQSQATRILYIEDGIGFGGSVISLSELVKGLGNISQIEPYVLTYQQADVIDNLFPHAQSLHINKRLNYRAKLRWENFLEKRWITRLLKPLLLRAYVLLDILYQFVLGIKVYRLVKKHKIDLIHCNNGFQMEAVRGADLAGIHCIMHFRGLPDPSISKRFSLHRDWIDRVISRVVAISGHVSLYLQDLGMPKEKLITIFNPIDIDLYRNAAREREAIRNKHDIAEDEIVIALFGRITGWKGTLEFLQALQIALPKCPQLKGMLVGDDSDSEDPVYTQKIHDLLDSPELKGRVVLTGYQNQVQNYYVAVDVVAHTSIEPEPFGRVVIEGMASGKAVIAMDEGGPPEILQDGIDGILVPPRDVKALAEAIERVYHDNDLRLSLGNEALKSAEAGFTNTQIARQVLEIYEQAIPEKLAASS